MLFTTTLLKSKYWKKMYFPRCNWVSIHKLNVYVHNLMENKIMKNREMEATCEWCSLKIAASKFWKKKKKRKMRDSVQFWQNIWKIFLKSYGPNPCYFTKKELLQRYFCLKFCLLFRDIYFKELLWIAASEERKFQTSWVNNIKTKHI